ncbi:ATP-grasp fold amidoligase family protein [Capnocytophaga canimorsus]|uniref:ATP-grasp fold amidoligase family protein n=1 Tax=Capnocytophaga canimorsus TaxID=28188 RepID=UPI0037D769EF
MKALLKKIYKKTWLGKVALQPFLKIYRYLEYKLISDESFLKRKFEQTQGFPLDLKNPKTLNAKMQWLKINDLTPLHTLCADKYGVREFVQKEVGAEYLVPVLFRTNNPKELTKENLPHNTNFIIKTTHDSSGGVIVRGDKELDKIDFQLLQKKFTHLLKSKHYRGGRENQYRDIKPQIIVEQLLEDKKGKIPNDYKFHCFNGKAKVVYVSVDREGKNKRNIYDIDWNPLYFTWLAPEKDASNLRGEEIEKPQNYEKMIQIAEKLASHFLYVRVDLYNVEGKIYVGELTFHHGSGFEHIRPIEWDYKMGEMLKLPFE